MSTVEKGNAFEDRVFLIVQDLVSKGQMFFLPEKCKVFKKKGYYSRDRDKEIIVDISIETYFDDFDKWSLLTVIECKDYKDSVPVNDIEEFNSKLQQIAGANVKGIVITSKSYQDSALSYANSRGIGLIRLQDTNSFYWDVKRLPREKLTVDHLRKRDEVIKAALLKERYENSIGRVYGSFSFKYYLLISELVADLYRDQINKLNELGYTIATPIQDALSSEKIEHISIKNIEQEAYRVLSAVDGSILLNAKATPLNDVSEYIKKVHDVEFIFDKELGNDSHGFEILGKALFKPAKILITNKFRKEQYRWRFTLAHEIGHFVFGHGNVLNEDKYSEYLMKYPFLRWDDDQIEEIERQANKFAAFLLMPREPFVKLFLQTIDEYDIRPKKYGILFIDAQKCNIKNFLLVTDKLMSVFRVSRLAIEYHLKNMKLINDQRKKMWNDFG